VKYRGNVYRPGPITYWKSVIEVIFRGLQGRVYIYYCRVTRMYYNFLRKAGTTVCQASAHQISIPELPYPVGSPTLRSGREYNQ
jgi:hypothetical protein